MTPIIILYCFFIWLCCIAIEYARRHRETRRSP